MTYHQKRTYQAWIDNTQLVHRFKRAVDQLELSKGDAKLMDDAREMSNEIQQKTLPPTFQNDDLESPSDWHPRGPQMIWTGQDMIDAFCVMRDCLEATLRLNAIARGQMAPNPPETE